MRTERTIDLGTIPNPYREGGARYRILAHLAFPKDELNPGDREVETTDHRRILARDARFLAVTWTYGTAAEIRRGDGSGGAGIDPELIDALSEPERAKARRLVEIGDRWHLNTMRASCDHQTVVWETGRYGRQPSLELTKPCPITGYRYGSAWLVEPLPDELLRELETLAA